jgi:hypothetical protein
MVMKLIAVGAACLIFMSAALFVQSCCKPPKPQPPSCPANQMLYNGDSCDCNHTSLRSGDSCYNMGTLINDSAIAQNRFYLSSISSCGDWRDSLQLQCAKHHPIRQGLFLSAMRGSKRWLCDGIGYIDTLYDIGYADSFNLGFVYFYEENTATFEFDIDCDISGWQSKDKDSVKLYIVPKLTKDTCISYLRNLN